MLSLYNRAWDFCGSINRRQQEIVNERLERTRKSRAINPTRKPHIYVTKRGKWGCVAFASEQIVRAYATTPTFAYRAWEQKAKAMLRWDKYKPKWRSRSRTTEYRQQVR